MAGLGREAVVFLLFLVSLMNYVDRWSVAAILNELQRPPAADGGLDGGFGLSDTAAGLVSSVFVATYMLLSPVFGYLGDRLPRVPLIFFGGVLYATSVFLSSFCRFYWQFLTLRSFVGIGEASFAILAPTIIADLYPAGPERTSALGYFCTSIPLGSAMGYVYAGEVARVLGWRYAFRISPFLSFALSGALLLSVAEPERGGVDGVAQTPRPVHVEPKESWFKDVRAVLSTPSFLRSNVGAIGMTFTSGALAQWAPAFLQRVNCQTADAVCSARVTRTFGIMTMITGTVGTLSGSRLSRWYSKRNPAADALVCAFGLLLATPCVYASIYLAPWMPGVPTWSAIFLGELLVSVVWAPYSAILLSVVSPQRRSTANSISLLTTHLFGDSMSPVLIGYAADALHKSKTFAMTKASSLQHALYLSVISTLVGAVFFIFAGGHLARDRAAAFNTSYRPVEGDGDDSDSPLQVPARASRTSRATFTIELDDGLSDTHEEPALLVSSSTSSR